MTRTTQPPAERFWAKVNKSAPLPTEGTAVGACWLWTGAVNRNGYGNFWYGSRTVLAHRWAYEQTSEQPIPADLVCDHLCRRRNCVRPSHIQPVTSAENTRRGISGEVNGGRQRAKTHCPHGHAYDEINTYVGPDGSRQCRTCRAEREAANRDATSARQRDRYANDPEYRERKRAEARERMRAIRAQRRANNLKAA